MKAIIGIIGAALLLAACDSENACPGLKRSENGVAFVKEIGEVIRVEDRPGYSNKIIVVRRQSDNTVCTFYTEPNRHSVGDLIRGR